MGWLELRARRARSRLSFGPLHSSRKRTVALSALFLGIVALASPLCPLVSTTSSSATTPTVAPAIDDVACADASQCVAVGGLGASVLVSTDAGATWSRVTVPTHHSLYGVACPTPSRCVAVGDAGVALSTNNAGRAWSAAPTGVSVPLSGVSCPTALQCTAVGDNDTVLESTDGGSRWTRTFSKLGVMDGVSCGSPAHCSAVTSNANATLTTTDGTAWEVTPAPFSIYATLLLANGISCIQQRCVEVGDRGAIAVSDDGGLRWTNATTGTTNLYGVTCVSMADCVAVGAAGTVLHTTNGGATWMSEVPPTGENLLGVSCPVVEECVAVGGAGTVLTSSDGGSTWTVRAGTPAPAQQRQVLMLGDSFAGTLAEGLARNSPAYGMTIINGSTDGCALAIGGPMLENGQPSPEGGLCATSPGWGPYYKAEIAKYHPALSVVVLGPWDLLTRLLNGKYQAPGQPAYDAYFRQQVATALQILTTGGGRVVITTAPYVRQRGPEYCAPKPATVANCPSEGQRVAALDSAAKQAAADFPGSVTLVDLGRELSPSGKFVSSVDGVTVRRADGVHVTTAGDDWLAPWLLPRLLLAAQTSGASATSP